MKITDDGFTLSTGREEYANLGIIGLCGSRGSFGLSGGYDQIINDEHFTPEEKRELAAYMVEVWKEYGGIK